MKPLALAAFFALLFAPAAALRAQEQIPYGTPITLAQARKITAAAEESAGKNKWNMVIAVCDPGGHLVSLVRMDNTQTGSVVTAQRKASSAVAFRRSTKVFQDMLAEGGDNLRILALEGAVPLEGGVPILVDGKIIGALGISGGTSKQDGVVAQAAIEAFK